jgi:phage-related baseplate assembly protein
VLPAAAVAALRAHLVPLAPVADFVDLVAASAPRYAIEATLRVGRGADAALVREEARHRLGVVAARAHRVAGDVPHSILDAAGHVVDRTGVAIVGAVSIASPPASIVSDPYAAPWCEGVSVNVEVIDD